MLRQRLQDDMKAAMKAGEKERLGAIRLINAAIKQREVDERIVLGDAQVLTVLDKMAKQRRESISQFRAAGREDLVTVEEGELRIIQTYLPEALSETEIAALIDAGVAETAAVSIADMGRVMAILKPKIQGRADMSAVSARVRARLG